MEWTSRGTPPGGKGAMEGQLMNYDKKKFYIQTKLEQLNKKRMMQKLKAAVIIITLGVIIWLI